VQTRLWWEDLSERDQLENLDIDWRIIVKWVFKKWDSEAWNGLIWFRTGIEAGRF
jgi:hypothetical protein